jgi:hypothetical protein
LKSKKRFIVIVAICFVCGGLGVFAFANLSVNNAGQQPVTSAPNAPKAESSFFSLMADAKPIDVKYQFNFSVLTDYDAESVDMYLFDHATNSMHPLGEKISIINNIVTHNRRISPIETPYLVLRLRYGPKFTYERHSEAVCITKLQSHIRLDPIACNPLTTSEFLFAAAMENVSSENLFTANAIKRAISLKRLPQSITLQRLYAVHQYVLAHVAESPQYQLANKPDLYLCTLYPLFQNSISKLLKFRRVTIKDMDHALVEQDSSMVNIGYRIYMALELLIKRHSQTQPKIQSNPQAMKNFFNGSTPFTILGSDSDLVANLEINDTIRFDIWPWFSYVEISLDEQAPIQHRFGDIPLLGQHNSVSIRGFGENGRYVMLRQHIKHATSAEQASVAVSGALQ